MVFETLGTYLSARHPPKTREAIVRHQADGLKRLRRTFARSRALAPFAATPLSEIPVIDTSTFRARFEDYGTTGLSHADALRAAEAAERGQTVALPHGLSAGFSTGTGGAERGLFVTSASERAIYAGLLMGRLFSPRDLIALKRVAVCLRAGNALYDRPRVRFFGLGDSHRDDAIAAYRPQALIAPAHVLLDLAERGPLWPGLRHLFYGAETLNAAERAYVQDRLKVRPDPIYQATEGFLGAPCRLGTLHLNEDSLIIEREALGGDRFRPVITDLRRTSQLVVRLRLEDILRPVTCACGSALSAVAPVEGRIQDVWCFGGRTFWPAEIEALVTARLAPQRRWIATAAPDAIRYGGETDDDADAIFAALAPLNLPLIRVPYDRAQDIPKRRHVRWQA